MGIETKLLDNLSFSLENQLRLENNARQFRTTFVETGFQINFTKFLRIAPAYRFTRRFTSKDHRLSVDVILKEKIEPAFLEVVFRTRYQEGFERGSPINERGLRPKISLRFAKKKLDIKPFLAGELFYELSNEGSEFNKYRLSTGFGYALAKHASVKLAYIFQSEFNVANPATISVVSVGLSFNLKSNPKLDLSKKERAFRKKLKVNRY